MVIWKKINYIICIILISCNFLSFVMSFNNITVSSVMGIFLLLEIVFLISEQGNEEREKIDYFIKKSKNLYCLNFSKLQNIKEMNLNSNNTFTIVLKNGLFFSYEIDLLPISQDTLEVWDLKFDSLKMKENNL